MIFTLTQLVDGQMWNITQMFESFHCLNTHVIEKSTKVFSEEFNAGIERLTHSVEV